MSRAIGIDVGSRRVGVSLSDEAGAVATAHETLDAGDDERLVDDLCELIDSRGVETVVVGWPLHMDGTEGRATRAVDRFVERLESGLAAAGLKAEIVRWDERLTSSEAEDVLVDADLGRRRRREVIDRVAATRILQSYLNAH